VTGVRRMPESAAVETLAVRRRRESRHEERQSHIALAALLNKHLDPACTFWTSLENKPLSMISGIFQKRRGVVDGANPSRCVAGAPLVGRGLPASMEAATARGMGGTLFRSDPPLAAAPTRDDRVA
jgi:hypothetical protein